jgi:hypothetical protein
MPSVARAFVSAPATPAGKVAKMLRSGFVWLLRLVTALSKAFSAFAAPVPMLEVNWVQAVVSPCAQEA